MLRKRKRGSLTLEASVVLPLFLFFFLSFLSVIEMLKGTMERDFELSRSTKTLALLSPLDTMIDLMEPYIFSPRCNVFGIPDQMVMIRSRAHPWTGYKLGSGGDSGGSMEDTIVYITDTGTVYHLSRSCTHLDLSIRPVDSGQVGDLRNSGGARYRRCEICGGGSGLVYITDEGDRYHSSLTCSGLKRTIYEIPISQVGARRLCSRCAGR